ncbi:hypothetical protein [Bradyrhizobium sp.]|uniref:hypothetical protein n=1 Tax=Bradyrhizobium sp. TaxID=376 RepID=UPI0025C323B7|nr:hypothetical protein [Bradyrhizobium sp.]
MATMIDAVDGYFRFGQRVCIQGALVLARTLGDSRIFTPAMSDMTTRLLAKPARRAGFRQAP